MANKIEQKRVDKPSDLFQTPTELFEVIDKHYGPIIWDACCSKDNCLSKTQKAYCEGYITGQELSWHSYDYLSLNIREISNDIYHHCQDDINNYSTIFMNPPYSSPRKFIEKAWEDSKNFRVICLVKADHSVKWYRNLRKESRWVLQYGPQDNNENTILQYADAINKSRPELAIIELPERIRFDAPISAMMRDASNYPDKAKFANKDLVESKHFRLATCGTKAHSKGGGTFPSWLLIMDRRK